MTVRPGQYWARLTVSFTLGGATGVQLNLQNSSWAVLVAATFSFTATATVGNRQLVFRVIEPTVAGILFQNVAAAAITTGQVVRVSLGAGLPNQSFAVPLTQIVGLPVEMPIPPLSQLQVFDSNNVDANDAINFYNTTTAM